MFDFFLKNVLLNNGEERVLTPQASSAELAWLVPNTSEY